MAGAKDPRSLMINLMYLVFMALLALNVAGEILNAFKIIDDSIIHSNLSIQDKNKILLAQFDQEIKAQGEFKVRPYKQRAIEFNNKAEAVIKELDALREEFIKESDPKVDKKTKKRTYKEDDLDAATRVMIVRSKGPALKKKLEDLRKFYLDNVCFPEDKVKQAKLIPLSTELTPETKALVMDNVVKDPDWTYVHFHMMATVAAVTILDKFKNDVVNTESIGLEYLLKKINAADVKFDRFEPLVSSKASYLMVGQTFEAAIGIGAFSSTSQPKILVNGVPLPVRDGKAIYKEEIKTPGRRNLKVRVIMKLPDGRDQPFDKELSYEAGIPSGATVTADKVNVLYRGIENPITVSAGAEGQERIKVEMSNAKYSGTRGHYMVTPGAASNVEVLVRTKLGVNKFNFRVKDIPPPLPMVGDFSGGAVPISVFRAQGGVKAVLKDFLFEGLNFSVLSYRIGAAGPGFPDGFRLETNEGSPWKGRAQKIINQAKPGAKIFIDDIQVKGPDGRTSKLTPLVFTLR